MNKKPTITPSLAYFLTTKNLKNNHEKSESTLITVLLTVGISLILLIIIIMGLLLRKIIKAKNTSDISDGSAEPQNIRKNDGM